MGGDDFNKTDDGEENSNYEIDISAIIEQSIKEHDKNIDQLKSVNRVWRDSFFEAIWRDKKNKVNNEITKTINQGFSRTDYAVYQRGKRSIYITLNRYVMHEHPPFRDRRKNDHYQEKSGTLFMSVEYFFDKGLKAGTRGKNSISVDAISGQQLQDSFCSYVKGKIAGCKSVNLTGNIVKRTTFFGKHEEEYTQYEMEIVW